AAKPRPKPEPPAPDPASLVAGRYRLVSLIGGGAMGVVWRARDEVLGRDVAVKELRPDHGMSGAQVRTSHQRARREGRIAARLQHPNAVVIYDVAEHDGRPYLIMEYVPSQSLGDILATGAVLTPTEVTSIGAQLASALTAAHERGIVHRDIKPGNVLMTSDGTVKLTDFGISRATGDATVTATGEILGTPAYTAPEVAQGHPVAFPADVFSLGATLYAAVEGIPPFGEDANAMATLLRVVRNEMRRPKRSGPLTDTILRMLSPEPIDRPTMKDVWQGLDALGTKPLPPVARKPQRGATRAFDAPSPTVAMEAGSAMGSIGAAGAAGAVGAAGAMGAAGAIGSAGAMGSVGPLGPVNALGQSQSPLGPIATPGTTGAKPAPGPATVTPASTVNQQASSATLPKSTTAMPSDPVPTTAMAQQPKAVTPLVPR
ncbi:serine/threonine protein kinase, partial [Catenulispora sp. NF23]|uniref:serine/threonine-protein kinase n=1 Tax=Catenulispora pinistramenti TaxID=2705254 RepID=UPI001BA5EF3A